MNLFLGALRVKLVKYDIKKQEFYKNEKDLQIKDRRRNVIPISFGKPDKDHSAFHGCTRAVTSPTAQLPTW